MKDEKVRVTFWDMYQGNRLGIVLESGVSTKLISSEIWIGC